MGIPQPVEFFGCTALRDSKDGPVCMLTPDDKMVFWVRDRACDSLAFAEGGQAISFTGSIVQGGCQARITSSTSQVHTALQINDRSTAQSIYSLSLDRSKPNLLAAKRRYWDRSALDLEDAIPELRRRLSEPLDAETQLDLAYSIALIAMKLGDRQSAIRDLIYVAELAIKLGYRSIAFESTYRTANLYTISAMPSESEHALATAETLRILGDSRSNILYYWEMAMLFRSREKIQIATENSSLAVAAAERVADRVFQRVATSLHAEMLIKQDRIVEAAAVLDTVESLLQGAPECGRAELLRATGFACLLIARAQPTKIPIVTGRYVLRELFLRALDASILCQNSTMIGNVYSGLASVALLEGDYQSLRKWIDRARQQPGLTAITRVGLIELDALQQLAAGHIDESIRLFRQLGEQLQQAPTHHQRQMECRLAVGMAEALQKSGKPAASEIAIIRDCINNQEKQLTGLDIRFFQDRVNTLHLMDPRNP